MSQQGPFLFLVALLCIAGVGTAAFRHAEYRIPWLPGEQQNVWEVEARIRSIQASTSATSTRLRYTLFK